MTKEEVEQSFNGLSPYYAYKQGVQDGIAYNEESFRREAAKDILCEIINKEGVFPHYRKENQRDRAEQIKDAIMYADKLIAKLKEK